MLTISLHNCDKFVVITIHTVFSIRGSMIKGRCLLSAKVFAPGYDHAEKVQKKSSKQVLLEFTKKN